MRIGAGAVSEDQTVARRRNWQMEKAADMGICVVVGKLADGALRQGLILNCGAYSGVSQMVVNECKWGCFASNQLIARTRRR